MISAATLSLFLAACLALLAGPVLAEPSPLASFKAEYAAARNGKQLGRTTIELIDNRDDTWTLRTSTIGTAGLASLAGLDVVEESRLRWRDGRPETLAYDFRQKAALRSKRRHGEFDWAQREVRMVDGDSDARYALVDGTVDRHAVTVALVADLAKAPPLAAFNQGDAKYPDRSTTLVVQLAALEGGPAVGLRGPGIRDEASLALPGLPPGFWDQVQTNGAQFQFGVDLIFVAGDRLAALPRTTRVTIKGE